MTTDTHTDSSSAIVASDSRDITTRQAKVSGPSIRVPKYWLRLLRAARKVEAHSHIDLEANEYHVDVLAMANLCGALGNRKFTKHAISD